MCSSCPYSADFNHSSSLPMINFMEDCFEAAGVTPDLVLSGHVHTSVLTKLMRMEMLFHL
ncbi:hypothetical protein CS542_02890 [Pedobacter sp. IW39]|nr:hypothetical protein CS542_02890 [Pedobacter sp. IW39]